MNLITKNQDANDGDTNDIKESRRNLITKKQMMIPMIEAIIVTIHKIDISKIIVIQ